MLKVLIKLIDTNDSLSVQVHPDDDIEKALDVIDFNNCNTKGKLVGPIVKDV